MQFSPTIVLKSPITTTKSWLDIPGQCSAAPCGIPQFPALLICTLAHQAERHTTQHTPHHKNEQRPFSPKWELCSFCNPVQNRRPTLICNYNTGLKMLVSGSTNKCSIARSVSSRLKEGNIRTAVCILCSNERPIQSDSESHTIRLLLLETCLNHHTLHQTRPLSRQCGAYG